MPDILTEHGAVEPGHAYTVSITRLRIRNMRLAPAFFRGLGGVLQQTGEAPGLVRHGFRIRPLTMTFWTYGVFDEHAALGRYSGSQAHGPLMRHLRGRLGPLDSARVTLHGTDLPTDWDGIAALLAQHGRSAPRRRGA